MAYDPDPYRTLGLERGASPDEVKRAYRRLAKANHPDAAGEAALPRFLAIQSAYEQIAGPGAARADAPRRGAAPPRRPWDADPQRADATRRAYGGRARRPRPADASGGGSRSARASPGGSGATRGADSSTSGAQPPGESTRSARRRRATLGSTSYDEAESDPFEPDWGGASWYGTTSGTYWTINPKEYADPRKHGPEYQARARRDHAEVAGGTEPPPEPAAPAPTGAAPAAAPSHSTSSWWDSTAGHAAAEAAEAAADPRRQRRPTAPRPPAPPEPPRGSPRSVGRNALSTWFDSRNPGLVVRVARAVIGWAPIALGLGWLSGEMTGCARFSASCDAGSAPLAWLAQLTVLALLLIVPVLARSAAIATVATLAAAIPGTLILSVAGGSNDEATVRPLLGGLLVIAWLVGLAYAVARHARDGPAGEHADETGSGEPDGHVS